MKRLMVMCAALLVPALALAQPKTAEDFYKDGETAYNLGNFAEAIEAFKKGFELEPVESKKAAYLYNIGQSYRQDKDCSNAQFFYKRYLVLKDGDARKPLRPETRAEIEDRIKELEECARQQEAIRNKPPDQNLKPGDDNPPPNGGKTVAVVPDPDEDDEDDGEGITVTTPGGAPTVVSLRLAGGGAKVNTGDLSVPIQATVALIGGYPLALADGFTLELGAGFTFTPVPYEQTGTMASKNASLIAVVANAGATYEVIPKLGLRGDLGIGGLFFGGINESPFTGNQPTTGALTMLHVRVAVSADYAITPNIIATVIPFAFSYSPAKTGLRDDIKSITAVDFMVGLGYRM